MSSPSPVSHAASRNETKPTPGPWQIRRSQRGYPYQIEAPNGSHVRDVTRWAAISVPSLPEGEANARLIASAPDLLEALTSLKTLAECDPAWHDPSSDTYPVRFQVEAAIRLATTGER